MVERPLHSLIAPSLHDLESSIAGHDQVIAASGSRTARSQPADREHDECEQLKQHGA